MHWLGMTSPGIKFPGYLVGVCGALDALCACTPTHSGLGRAEAAAFAQRWQALLSSLAVVFGHPPYTEAELRVAAADTAATEAMMAASDALYAAMLARTRPRSSLEAEAAWRLTADAAAVAWLYQQAILPPSAPQPVAVSTGVVTTLREPSSVGGRRCWLARPAAEDGGRQSTPPWRQGRPWSRSRGIRGWTTNSSLAASTPRARVAILRRRPAHRSLALCRRRQAGGAPDG